MWLRKLNKVHIGLWGQHVTPYDITENEGKVKIVTTIENHTSKNTKAHVLTRIIDHKGITLSSTRSAVTLIHDRPVCCEQDLVVNKPLLWSTESPNLYTVISDIVVKGQIVDTYSTVTGFRNIRFDAKKGFFLNDKPMKINGVCLHHDAGALGAVVNTRAIERQLVIMRDMGANAIRCSHNPPAPELLDLCDKMGLLVMDETFDMWRKKKTEHDYARYFNDWHEKDLNDLIMRDRNHPSIVMWSIGNEVLEQWSHAEADTLSLEQANLILNFGHGKEMLADENSEKSVNSLLTEKLANMVRKLDSTRPVTAGCNEPEPGNHLFRSGALDRKSVV